MKETKNQKKIFCFWFENEMGVATLPPIPRILTMVLQKHSIFYKYILRNEWNYLLIGNRIGIGMHRHNQHGLNASFFTASEP